MTKLLTLCRIFGWQGGTIHDANREVQNCLEDNTIDVLSMRIEDFDRLVKNLKYNYPKWLAYHKEESRE